MGHNISSKTAHSTVPSTNPLPTSVQTFLPPQYTPCSHPSTNLLSTLVHTHFPTEHNPSSHPSTNPLTIPVQPSSHPSTHPLSIPVQPNSYPSTHTITIAVHKLTSSDPGTIPLPPQYTPYSHPSTTPFPTSVHTLLPPQYPWRSQAVLDETLENIYQLTPTVWSAFRSSVYSSLCICWSEPTRFRYFWFVHWPFGRVWSFLFTPVSQKNWVRCAAQFPKSLTLFFSYSIYNLTKNSTAWLWLLWLIQFAYMQIIKVVLWSKSHFLFFFRFWKRIR